MYVHTEEMPRELCQSISELRPRLMILVSFCKFFLHDGCSPKLETYRLVMLRIGV